ncbi:MAG: hypothetical protein ACR2HN_13355 [Tepidiformaceae bacterium]
MARELSEAVPGAALLTVWTPMLDADDEAAARSLPGGAAGNFYDPARLAGRAVAALLGAPEGTLAWDIYLFYRAGVQWAEPWPTPVTWVHQLGPLSWARPERFAWGKELPAAFRRALAEAAE